MRIKAISVTILLVAIIGIYGVLSWWLEPTKKLQRAAEQGDLQAMFALAQHFSQPPENNSELAMFWYEKAAEKGHIHSMRKIVEWYSLSDADNPDKSNNAAKWLGRLAEWGDPPAQFKHGMRLLKDDVDDSEAWQWIENSAKNNYIPAKYSLGKKMLEEEENRLYALRYLRRAAEANHSGAQYLLGMYLIENSTNRNEAAQFLAAAARAGISDAYIPLARVYLERSNRAQRDFVEPFLELAWQDGDLEAVGLLARIHVLNRSRIAEEWLFRAYLLDQDAWQQSWDAKLTRERSREPSHVMNGAWAIYLSWKYSTRLPSWVWDDSWHTSLAIVFASHIAQVFERLEDKAELNRPLLERMEDYYRNIDELVSMWGEEHGTLKEGLKRNDPEALAAIINVFQSEKAIVSGEFGVRILLELGMREHFAEFWEANFEFFRQNDKPQEAEQILLRASNEGHARAFWLRSQDALAQEFGGSVERRINRWLAIAADGGVKEAEELLRDRILKEAGWDFDNLEVFNYMLKLAREGELALQAAIASWSKEGNNFTQYNLDEEEISNFIDAAAEAGFADVAYWKALELRRPVEDQRGKFFYPLKAIDYLKTAAENEHAEAMFLLALVYIDNDDLRLDFKMLYQLMRGAAELGHNGAKLYFEDLNQGSWHRFAESSLLNFYHKAVYEDDPAAMLVLGQHYLHSNRDFDLDLAFEWIERAAELEHIPAYHFMFNVFWNGNIVDQDRFRAVRWIEAAAELDDGEALYILSNMHRVGAFFPQDDETANDYLFRSAETGFMPAIELLRSSDALRNLIEDQSLDLANDILKGARGYQGIYPVVPVMIYEGHYYPVVDYRRNRPVIALRDGSNQRMEADAMIHLMPYPRFSEIAVTDIELIHNTPFHRVGGQILITGGEPHLAGHATMSRDVSNVLMLVVSEDYGKLRHDWFRLGDFRAGVQKRIRARLPKIIYQTEKVAVFFFAGGEEILSSVRTRAVYQSYRRDSNFAERKPILMRDYASDATKPARRWSRWDDTIFVTNSNGNLPDNVEFKLSLNAQGLVEGIEALTPAPVEVLNVALERLLKLQFIPAVTDGEPVPSTVVKSFKIH